MITTRAKIQGGRIFPHNEQPFRAALSAYEGREVTVTIKRHREASSLPQLKYYWSVIVGSICAEFGYGPEDRDQVHLALKQKFLGQRQDNGLVLVPSYRELDTAAAERYHEDIRRWMLTEHNCNIPLPNEVPVAEFELN